MLPCPLQRANPAKGHARWDMSTPAWLSPASQTRGGLSWELLGVGPGVGFEMFPQIPARDRRCKEGVVFVLSLLNRDTPFKRAHAMLQVVLGAENLFAFHPQALTPPMGVSTTTRMLCTHAHLCTPTCLYVGERIRVSTARRRPQT